MTTITIKKPIKLSKKNFLDIDDLYAELKKLKIQEKKENQIEYNKAMSDYEKGENIIDGETAFKKLGV